MPKPSNITILEKRSKNEQILKYSFPKKFKSGKEKNSIRDEANAFFVKIRRQNFRKF